MDFEHLLQQSNFFLVMQMLMGSLLIPGMVNRADLYNKVVRVLAVNIVSFGPMAILLYVLYEVARLN